MKIAIIGAGASGLMLATLLQKNNIDYDIFNKDLKIGSKIKASGNGRCNISNVNFSLEAYHNNKLSKIVENNQKLLFDYFKELKIYTKSDDEGRMYPISENSQSVLDILFKHMKPKITLETIENINKNDKGYYLNDKKYGPYDKVVLAIGSPAGIKKYYYELFDSLELPINPFYPSLVGFKTKLKIKDISGVRAKANTYLYYKDNLIHEEKGEVIFKDDGISGIVIMNQSSYYNYLKGYNNVKIVLDLLDKDYDCLDSVLAPKILKYIKEKNIDPHNFTIPISDTYDLEFAQVAKGGISIKDLNENLSLKKDNNIYAIGEVLDIDGVCGGYNLMNAFCDAIEVYKDLKNEISNK